MVKKKKKSGRIITKKEPTVQEIRQKVLDQINDLQGEDEEDALYEGAQKPGTFDGYKVTHIMPAKQAQMLRNTYNFGRPAKYKTAKELQKKIEQYFKGGYRIKLERCKPYYDEKGEIRNYIEIPKITITDLVLFLGFESRNAFYSYAKSKKDSGLSEKGYNEFEYTIKRARVFIEREYEEMLEKSPSGAIFALKNFGWTDKTEHEMSGKVDLGIKDILDNIIK